MPAAIAAAPCGGELEAARKLLARESTCLLNTVVSSDALYTNNENARLIVIEKGGDYISSVKGNQPTLAKEPQWRLDDGTPFFCRRGNPQWRSHRAAHQACAN